MTVEPVPRPVRLHQIRSLLDAGLTSKQVAVALGVSYSTVRNALNDPDGSKQLKRRERYRTPCPKCGKPMHGSSGFNGAKKAKQCLSCDQFERRSIPIVHGHRNGYARGCRCRPCRDALSAYMRELYAAGMKPSNKPTPPERSRAYRIVQAAIKSGDLLIPECCENCGKPDKRTHKGGRWLQAHHEDYSKPLDVIFLCAVCHRQLHRRREKRSAPLAGGASDR